MLRDDLTELCLNCTELQCNGICDKARQAAGKADTSFQPLTLTYMGQTLSIKEWADLLGLQRQTLYNRLNKGLSIDEIFAREPTPEATAKQINRTYYVLAGMPVNYAWYCNHPAIMTSSDGFISNYGKWKTQPTNKISNPTMHQALNELQLTDAELEAMAWITIVLRIISYLEGIGRRYKKGQMQWLRGEILRRRALDGWNLKRITEYYNSNNTPVTIGTVRNQYKECVKMVANEAVKHGLVSDYQ